MVILSLIVKRARVKALFKDKRASVDAFGTYVEALVGDLGNMSFLSKVLRGVRAIICPANDGFFSDAGRMKGVQHVILLSQLDVYKGAGVFQAIINKKLRKFAERDEEVLITSGIPYTIVKAGLLQDAQGGKQGFCFDEAICYRRWRCVPMQALRSYRFLHAFRFAVRSLLDVRSYFLQALRNSMKIRSNLLFDRCCAFLFPTGVTK